VAKPRKKPDKFQTVSWLPHIKHGGLGLTAKPGDYMTIHRKEEDSMDMRVYINGVTYDLNGDYGIGYTHKGEKFLFDKEDFDKIAGYRWCFDKNGYVVAFAREFQYRKIIRLHHVIMGKPPKGKQIDHIRDTVEGLDRKADNRKSNLRFVTPAQNSYNKGLRSNNTSGHTGVYLKQNKYWLARVMKNGKSKSKGFPLDKYAEACQWQEKTAKKMHGEYAYVNCSIPPQTQQAEPGL